MTQAGQGQAIKHSTNTRERLAKLFVLLLGLAMLDHALDYAAGISKILSVNDA